MYILDHNLRFLVPSTIHDKSIESRLFLARALKIRRLFASCFGGATTIYALGDFIGEESRLISEKILVVESYTGLEALEENYRTVFLIASHFAAVWAQESIALNIDKKLYLIEPGLEPAAIPSLSNSPLEAVLSRFKNSQGSRLVASKLEAVLRKINHANNV